MITWFPGMDNILFDVFTLIVYDNNELIFAFEVCDVQKTE